MMYVSSPGREEVSRPVVTSWRRPVKTAVHQAVLDGRLHQVRLLVSKHGVNVDSKDMFGRTPLMLACLLENEEDGFKMVKIFLRAGAFLNVVDNMNRSALSYACMKGREEIVSKFLKEDILDVNCPDNDGNAPIHHAALCGNPRIVKQMTEVLVRFGLSVDGRNQQGYTPLLLACKYAHYASGHILLTDGQASPTLRDNEFFLNAYEWVNRSPELHQSLNVNRSRSIPVFPRFTRETTLYHQSSVLPAVCRHTKPPSHPLGQSLDVALRLPAVFSYFPVDKPEEGFIEGGGDARSLLLKAIDDIIYANQARLRPASRVSSVWTTRASHPGTAKLLAVARREKHKEQTTSGAGGSRVVVPDLRTLFKLYSDQYQPPMTYGRSDRKTQDATGGKGGNDQNNQSGDASWPGNEARVSLVEA